MKHRFRKLHSETGATMLITLVFMAFCVFIGGSVLASATANGARVKRSYESEQEYLSYRSAALLISEALCSYEPVEFQYLAGSGTYSQIGGNSSLSELRAKALDCAMARYQGSAAAYCDFFLTLTVTGSSVRDTCYARLVCNADYTLSVLFYPDDTYAAASDILSLEIPLESRETIVGGSAEGGTETPSRLILSWGTPKIMKGGV